MKMARFFGDKVAVWKQRIANESLKNSLGVRDDDNMGECLKVYRLIFGVDDESVQQVAQSMGTVVMEYKDNMKSQNFYTLRREDWKLRLKIWATLTRNFRLLRFLPCVCCCLRRLRHKRTLSLVAQGTKNILEKILRDSIFPPQI